jgi:predicted membrane channel-forming protein YqfA (hemolysin III family)
MDSLTPQVILIFIFGVIFVVTLIVLSIAIPEPSQFQYTTFRIVLALAAAGVAAIIPGFLSLKLESGTLLLIRAGGALAVFVIVYFVNPAKLAADNSMEEEPTVSIEGPSIAILGKRTYFTVLSENAVRGKWSVGGFEHNTPFVIDWLAPSHEIYIEPTDPSRVGNNFTITFTAYNTGGKAATTKKQFRVVSD